MMPKSDNNNNNHFQNSSVNNFNGEQVLFDTRPNILLYCDNIISKIIVLLLLIFLFNPILALVNSIQTTLLINLSMDLSNLTFITEVILFIVMLIVIAKILLDVLEWAYSKYTLTNNRIIIQEGLLNKERIVMPYQKVQDMEIKRSVLARIVGAGDIRIYGGHENSETILTAIPNPNKVEQIILEQVNNSQYRNSPSEFVGYEDKWQKNMGQHENTDMDSYDAIKRHQQQFKKYKK